LKSGAFKYVAAVSLGCLLLSTPAIAQTESWDTAYDRFFEAPGAEVSSRTDENGTEIREVMTPGEVAVIQFRDDGEVRTALVDQSDGGPVGCMRILFAYTKHSIDACSDIDAPEVAARLTSALDRIRVFVEENAVNAYEARRAESGLQREMEEFLEDLGDPGPDGTLICEQAIPDIFHSFLTPMVDSFASMSREEFNRIIDGALEVPRLPAKAPCL